MVKSPPLGQLGSCLGLLMNSLTIDLNAKPQALGLAESNVEFLLEVILCSSLRGRSRSIHDVPGMACVVTECRSDKGNAPIALGFGESGGASPIFPEVEVKQV